MFRFAFPIFALNARLQPIGCYSLVILTACYVYFTVIGCVNSFRVFFVHLSWIYTRGKQQEQWTWKSCVLFTSNGAVSLAVSEKSSPSDPTFFSSGCCCCGVGCTSSVDIFRHFIRFLFWYIVSRSYSISPDWRKQVLTMGLYCLRWVMFTGQMSNQNWLSHCNWCGL